MRQAQIVLCQLFKTREDPAIVLQLVVAALDQMSLFVQMPVLLAPLFAILARRHDDVCATFLKTVEELFAVITFVCQEDLEGEIFAQLSSLRLAVTLPGGEQKA